MTGKVQRTSVEQRGRQKGNKCLNYVAGEKESECAEANIFFLSISLWKTWSHLKDFTACINLRDVSSPSACVALGSLHKGSQRRSLCYFRATDNTPHPPSHHHPGLSGPLAIRANRLASRSDCKLSHTVTSLRDQNLTNELYEPPGSKERPADATDGTSVLHFDN